MYLVPMVLCLVYAVVSAIVGYVADVKRRDLDSQKSRYFPKVTVGCIVGDLLVSMIPLINLGFLVFEITPKTLKGLFSYLARVMDTPLVPKRPAIEPSKDFTKLQG